MNTEKTMANTPAQRLANEIQWYKNNFPKIPDAMEYVVRVFHNNEMIVYRRIRRGEIYPTLELYRFMDQCRLMFYSAKGIYGTIEAWTHPIIQLNKGT